MVPERREQGYNVLFYLALCVIAALPSCAAITPPAYSPASEVLYHEAILFVGGENNAPLNYALAINKFEQFRKEYPLHPRAREAGYWIQVLEKLQALKKIELDSIRE